MKIKAKCLSSLTQLLDHHYPASFDINKVCAYIDLAQAVRAEYAKIPEITKKLVEKLHEPDDPLGECKQYKLLPELEKLNNRIIELPDTEPSKIEEWTNLKLTPFQLVDLIECGILIRPDKAKTKK